MPSFLNLPPETIAFWLGFLAATVFWWLAGRLRALLPRVLDSIRQQIRASRRKSQEKVDEYLRRETLRHAQGLHLAAPLFALDEVLVPPVLIAPPTAFIHEGAGAPETLTGQVIPYLPDWPQMAAQYPVATLTLAESILNGVKVAVIGQPGCGKTVALAALASQMSRKDAALGDLAASVPLLLHALDLPLEPAQPDPLDVLVQALVARSSVMMQRQIPAFLRTTIQDDQLVLLLDGLDELPPEQVKKVAAYLAALFEKYPNIRAITTADPNNLDGLAKLGFMPMSLAGWKQVQCATFVKRWGELWTKLIAPEISKQNAQAPQPVDTRLLDAWLLADWGIYSPMDWTLKVWGAYAGDITAPSALEAGDAYVRRVTGNAIPEEALGRLAVEFVSQAQAGLKYGQLEHVLSKFKVKPQPAASSGQGEAGESKPKKKAAGQGEKKVSSGSGILDLLLDAGILAEHPGEVLRLISPALTGLLASWAGSELTLNLEQPVWSAVNCSAGFLAARGQGQLLVQSLLDGQDDPLYSRLLLAAGWLPSAPANADWRPALMRRMLQLVQQESIPGIVRARMVTAFACSNDPTNPLLFKQLLASPSPVTRQLAALGSGMIRSPKLVSDLTGLLADSIPDVRAAACLALAAYGGKTAAEIIPQVLMHGEESLQLAAAEALANDEAGQEILKNALDIDNLMVRRAAVLALAHVHAPWAQQRLEKVAVEDAQWVVRSAAGQAVENLQKPDNRIPAPQPHPSEAGWLIAFAGKQGVGIVPGQVPVDLLLTALKDGSLEEQLNALIYLKDHADWPVVQAVSKASCSDQPLLRDASQYVLWYLHASGIELPVTTSAY